MGQLGERCRVIPKKKKKTKRSSERAYADRLWSQLIKQRDGMCRRCGSQSNALEAAHIIPRRSLSVRYDPMNGLALCAATCHRAFDGWQFDREAFIEQAIGKDEFVSLKKRAAVLWDRTYPVAALRATLAQLKKAA